MQQKICSKCDLEKDIKEFPKLGRQCKLCISLKSNKYYYDNKEVVLKKQEIRYQKNKEILLKKDKERRQNNKKLFLERSKRYYQKNKEAIKKKTKKYYQENREVASVKKRKYYKENRYLLIAYRDKNKENISKKYKEYYENNKLAIFTKCKKYNKKRKESDPLFKLRSRVSGSIRNFLKKSFFSKNGKSILNFLPYTMEELKNHLESLFSHPDNLTVDDQVWMNWNNWGPFKREKWNDNDPNTWIWQIDHIIPHSTFLYTSMEDEEFKKCWALENLRPLRADLNQNDGVTRVRHKL